MIYDIHMHLIPQVDDGCFNDDMAVSMIYMTYLEKIEKVICTPHNYAFDNDVEEVKVQFENLKELCKQRCPFLSLFLGCEIYCRPEEDKMDEIVKKITTGIYPTMNGTNYVLVEFSTKSTFEEIEYCLTRIEKAGFMPIIAHIERYNVLFQEGESLHKDCFREKEAVLNHCDLKADEMLKEDIVIKTVEERFAEWKQRGYLFQMNGDSLMEVDNKEIYANACYLLEHRLIDFLGTDAHRTNNRPPDIKDAVEKMYREVEKEYVDAITYQNAERILGV